MKPFDPKTAKNGDICYGCYSKDEFIYIGPTPVTGHERYVIVYDALNERYKAMPSDNLRIKPTKRTVWINVYKKDHTAGYFIHDYKDEQEAITYQVDRHLCTFVGTYPLEIEE